MEIKTVDFHKSLQDKDFKDLWDKQLLIWNLEKYNILWQYSGMMVIYKQDGRGIVVNDRVSIT